MKIELQNKNLETKLTEIAQSKYITPELLISEILREYVGDTTGFEIDNTIGGIRKEAKRLSDEINVKLKLFEDIYEVRASLVEVTETQACQSIPQRYKIKVVL